jgi:hypothetical protein
MQCNMPTSLQHGVQLGSEALVFRVALTDGYDGLYNSTIEHYC